MVSGIVEDLNTKGLYMDSGILRSDSGVPTYVTHTFSHPLENAGLMLVRYQTRSCIIR